MESACTGTPRTARFHPALSGVRGRHDVCTRAAQVLRQRQLFARMIEATQGQVSPQRLLDGASQVAASGCAAPMVKVLELCRAAGDEQRQRSDALRHTAIERVARSCTVPNDRQSARVDNALPRRA